MQIVIKRGCVRDARRNFARNDHHAVPVPVQQIPRVHYFSSDPDRTSEIHQMDIGMGNRRASRKGEEAQLLHLLQIAGASVSNRPDEP